MTEQHPNDLSPISETLDDIDTVVAFQGDPERHVQAQKISLEAERDVISQQIEELGEEIEAGRAGPNAQERLDQLKQSMLAVDADRFELERKQGGKPS